MRGLISHWQTSSDNIFTADQVLCWVDLREDYEGSKRRGGVKYSKLYLNLSFWSGSEISHFQFQGVAESVAFPSDAAGQNRDLEPVTGWWALELHSLSIYYVSGIVPGPRSITGKKTDVISAYLPQDYGFVGNRNIQRT